MTKAFLEGAIQPGLFWDALLKSNLYVPVADGAETQGEDKGDTDFKDVPMRLGVDSQGRRVVWLFTSPDVMVEYTEQELPFFGMNAVALFQRLRDSEHDIVLIGPEGLTLKLHPKLIRTLAEGQVPEIPNEEIRDIPKNAPVQVGAPDETSSEALGQRFTGLFEDLPEVREATFIQIFDEPNGSRLLLGLRLTENNRERLRIIAGLVAKAAEGIMDKNTMMDITLIDGSLKKAFEKWGKTFFKR